MTAGLKVSNCLGEKDEERLSQFADDTTAAVTSDASLRTVFLLAVLYGLAPGARLNKSKCRGLWLGAWKCRSDDLCEIIQWCTTHLKIYSVYIGNDGRQQLNWHCDFDKFCRALNITCQRHFNSFLRKSLYASAVLCSLKIWYIGATLEMSRVCV